MDAVFSGEFLKYLLFIMAHRLKIYIISFLCMKGKTVQTILKYHFSETKVFMRSTM